MHSKVFASKVENTSYALFNFSLRSFKFSLIFHNDKKDKKKVIGSSRSHVTLPL